MVYSGKAPQGPARLQGLVTHLRKQCFKSFMESGKFTIFNYIQYFQNRQKHLCHQSTNFKKKKKKGSFCHDSAVMNPKGIHEDSGELWCRTQMWLGFHMAMAVAVAGSYSTNSTPSLRTSISCRCSPKKTKRRRRGRGLFIQTEEIR